MPENPEKFISSGKPKEPGKLTPEEVKEMVKKYKKEHEGLLPEYFSLPGEEKEEKREYSEETLLAHELKEFLEKMRPEIENKTLIKNAEEKLKSEIESAQKGSETDIALRAVSDYTSFKQSGLWSNFDQEFRDWVEENIKNPQLIKNAGEDLKSDIEDGEELGYANIGCLAICGYASFKQSGLWSNLDQEVRDWVEENIQNRQLIKNVERYLKSDIESGQKPGKIAFAWDDVYHYAVFKQLDLWLKFDQEFRDWVEENIKNFQIIKNAEELLKSQIESSQKPGKTWSVCGAISGYASFSQFQKILEEEGRRKEIAKATEKAMHPEKKLPPIPEEKAF